MRTRHDEMAFHLGIRHAIIGPSPLPRPMPARMVGSGFIFPPDMYDKYYDGKNKPEIKGGAGMFFSSGHPSPSSH
jgi:hypothetical protein